MRKQQKSQSNSLSQSIVQDPVQRQDIEREVAMCTTLHNPFIVTFFGQATTLQGKFFIVMEFVQHGSLGSLVKKGPLENPFKIRVLLDTARGMDFLHHNSFVLVCFVLCFFQFNSHNNNRNHSSRFENRQHTCCKS